MVPQEAIRCEDGKPRGKKQTGRSSKEMGNKEGKKIGAEEGTRRNKKGGEAEGEERISGDLTQVCPVTKSLELFPPSLSSCLS